MHYSYKLNVFLTQTGVVLFLIVAHSPPPPRWPNSPLGGNSPQVGDHWGRLFVPKLTGDIYMIKVGGEFVFEWGFFTLSASKAIFRVRTYSHNLFNPVMIIWWIKLGRNLPPGHNALLFSTSGTGTFIYPVTQTRLDIPRSLITQSHRHGWTYQGLWLPNHGRGGELSIKSCLSKSPTPPQKNDLLPTPLGVRVSFLNVYLGLGSSA